MCFKRLEEGEGLETKYSELRRNVKHVCREEKRMLATQKKVRRTK